MTTLLGSPDPLDEFLKPFVRGVQFVLGLSGTALTWWLAPMWAWPIPACLFILLGEVILWMRGNRVYSLTLTPHEMGFFRGSNQPEITLTIDSLTSANLYYQPHGKSHWHVWIVLRGQDECVGFQMECDATPTWETYDIPVDTMTALFGGNPSLLRAMVPRDHIIGQMIRDPRGDGLRWLRKHLPQGIWSRPAARIWPGACPPVDGNGMHTENPAGHLTVGESEWHVSNEAFTFSPDSPGLSSRPIPGLDGGLPLLTLPLSATVTLCFPAPALPTWWSKEASANEQSVHTHLAEGVAIFWAYLNQMPCESWPEPLRQALLDVDSLMGPLPSSLRRHMGLD